MEKEIDSFEIYKKDCVKVVGGPAGNYHFMWLLPDKATLEASQKSEDNWQIKADIPTYTIPQQSFEKAHFGHVLRQCNLALHEFYCQATGNQITSLTTAVKELACLREASKMEDADIIVDLWENNGSQSDKYKLFWECLQRFLQESTAVHECHDGNITYMAKAISVKDPIQALPRSTSSLRTVGTSTIFS